jgi:hypothetical protein
MHSVTMPKQSSTKAAKTVNLMLRLPPELHRALVKSATSQAPPSSLNGEIIARLHRDLQIPTPARQQFSGEMADAVADLREKMYALSKKFAALETAVEGRENLVARSETMAAAEKAVSKK